MHRSRPPRFLTAALCAVLSLLPGTGAGTALAQDGTDANRARIGLTLGGISLVGLAFEYQWGSRSVDVTLGTWAFQDVSLSVVGKQYLGPGHLRPFFGLGLWGVTAFPPEGGMGSVLVLRAPVGVDWHVLQGHALGAAMNISRGFWVRRVDPDDETPLNRRPVPLPGFYYRWRP